MVATILLSLCIGIVMIAAAFGIFYIVDNMCMDCDGLAHTWNICFCCFLGGSYLFRFRSLLWHRIVYYQSLFIAIPIFEF